MKKRIEKEIKSNPAELPVKKKPSGKKEEPKTKYVRLSQYNRVMATIRHPKYLEEYSEYVRLLNSGNEKAESLRKEIAEKWNQYSMLDSEFLLPIPPPNYNVGFKYRSSFNHIINNPVEIIDINKSDTNFEKYPQIELEEEKPAKYHSQIVEDVFKNLFKTKNINRKNEMLNKDNFSHILETLSPKYSYKKGRFLYLMIDLEESEEKITKALKSIIKKYKKYMPENKGRKRETTIDPWLVYDMRHRYNITNYSEIARKLSGLKGTASLAYEGAEGDKGNTTLHKWRDQVKTAYDKACQMIEQVGKEVKTN